MKTVYQIIAIFLCAIFIVQFSHAQSPMELFSEANAAFEKNDFNSAIQKYEAIHNQGEFSSDLYLNLGNAYFNNKNYSKAVLSYERGLRLAPNDDSLLKNLEITKDQLSSDIVEVPPFVLIRWWRALSNVFSTTVWAVVHILLLAFLAFIVGRFFMSNVEQNPKKLILPVSGFLFLLLLSFAAANTKQKMSTDDAAVVMTEIALREGPDERSGQLNELFPGNKVLIVDEIEAWYKVQLANQSIGWIPIESIEKI